jgi:hypothetical protein
MPAELQEVPLETGLEGDYRFLVLERALNRHQAGKLSPPGISGASARTSE